MHRTEEIMSVFEYDHTLPALPVPELSDTCSNLKELIKPLVKHDVWKDFCSELDSFEQSDGASLQEKLLQWKDSREGNLSWLRPIWDDNYLSYRDRSPVNMNYTFKLLHERFGEPALPKLLHSFCHILNRLRTESLPPEKIKETPLGMEALSHMIYTRIPSPHRDILYYLPLSTPYTVSVVCKGHWFLLALTDENDVILSPDAIQKALEDIRTEANSMPESAGVSAFTCAPRDEAVKLRSRIQEHSLNRMNMECIENSICVVCLEDVDEAGFMHNLMLGNPKNRWFDKSIQFVWDGHELGSNNEHSGCDAAIWLYLLNQIDDYALNQITDDQSAKPASFRALEWIVSDELLNELNDAIQDYSDLVSKMSVKDKKLNVFSREKIKEKKCRPDAVVQILYQAAYYKLTGRIRTTYEAVSTRSFYQGRTECLRPCSSAAADFAKCLVDSYVSQGENPVTSAELMEKFRAAEAAHMNQISCGQAGLGPERHISRLIAMHAMYTHSEPLPGIFATEGFRTLKHDAISTSSTTAPYIEYFGFCPVVPDGIGLGYGIKNDALHLVVCAYDDSTINPEEFLTTLEEMAYQFFNLF